MIGKQLAHDWLRGEWILRKAQTQDKRPRLAWTSKPKTGERGRARSASDTFCASALDQVSGS